MSRIGIVMEEESGQKIVEVMIEKLGIVSKPKIVQSNGKGNLIKGRWKKFVYGRLGDCSKKIILVDYDTDPEFEKTLSVDVTDNDVMIHFVKESIESWILGCFGVKNPDNLSDPVSEIKKILRRKHGAKRKYIKTVDGPKIAKRNELKHFRASKSFKKFEEILIKPCSPSATSNH